MALESALYSSQTGLDAHARALSVIGDNVSNANTTGFKSGAVQFSDLLTDGAEEANSAAGPVVGDGVVAASVRQDHGAGATEITGRGLDLSIDGEGYIAVGTTASTIYTRAGSLIIDENGLLANTAGENVLGYTGTDTATLGTIDMLNLNLSGQASTNISVFANLDASEGTTTLPVDPQTFNDIGSLASFTSSVTAYDSLGQGHDVTLALFKTEANNWTAQAYIDGADVGAEAGTPVQLGADATLTFETNGQMSEANAALATITGTPAYANGAAAGNFTLDLGRFSQFAGNSVTTSITQDGEGTGDVSSYSIESNGDIFAVLSNGTRAQIGSIPLANFNNKEGLIRVGNSSFAATETSGAATLGTAGIEGRGSVNSGSLELSNVDLSVQFTDMVIYQRGYSASSQVFSTAGDMMRDTINLMG